jgi:hypothetical protein
LLLNGELPLFEGVFGEMAWQASLNSQNFVIQVESDTSQKWKLLLNVKEPL